MANLKLKVDWEAVKADPVEFATVLLKNPDGTPVQPHPAQAELLRGIKRNTSIVTGRQFGKTHGMGIDVTWFSVTHDNREVMIIAPSLEQARIMFNEVAAHFRRPPLAYLVKGKIKEYPFPVIQLANGSSITARGANSPQYIRGNHPHRVYVDEAAFIKDTTITDVIEPLLLVTGQTPGAALVLISTPFGRGAFYDACEFAKAGEDPDSAYFHFTSFDNPYADRKQLERVKARYGEDSLVWRTEYMGLFDNDDRAVFPWADIRWATENWTHVDPESHEVIFPIKPLDKHRYAQGVDLANMRDWFVATMLDCTDPEAVPLVRMDRHQRKGYPFYKNLVRANHIAYHKAKTLIDATSLGESVVQDLPFAQGYKFGGAEAKWEVVQELARMLSEHRLLLPPDRTIIDELRYFEFIITPSKKLKMEASQGHDDIVMSLALGAHQALIPQRLGLFRSVDITPLRTPRPDYDPWVAAFRGE